MRTDLPHIEERFGGLAGEEVVLAHQAQAGGEVGQYVVSSHLLGTEAPPFHTWRQEPVLGSQAEVLHVWGGCLKLVLLLGVPRLLVEFRKIKR